MKGLQQKKTGQTTVTKICILLNFPASENIFPALKKQIEYIRLLRYKFEIDISGVFADDSTSFSKDCFNITGAISFNVTYKMADDVSIYI